MRFILVAYLLGVGCVGTGLPLAGASDGGARQSAVDASPPSTGGHTVDAAIADLAATMTTGNCAGTSIAGTCVEAFFAPMLSCFQGSGACTKSGAPMGPTNLCFANGSKVYGMPALGTQSEMSWMGASNQCFMKSIVTLDAAGVAHFQYLEDPVPGQLDYDEHTGDATCPDGTVVHIGPSEGCGDLAALLAPWRTAMCSDGVCQ